MELNVTTTVYIDMDYLVNMAQEKEWKDKELDEIVHDFVSGLDDCDYYLIGPEEERQIIAELEKRLKNLKK
jgi:hypothetical protein